MEHLVRLGFATLLLVLTLSLAFRFLAVPMALLRKAGALRAVRWSCRKLWGGVVGLHRLLTARRRRKIRRPLGGAFIRLFK